MKAILAVALRSAWSRRSTLALVLLSVALSSFLLLGVERLRQVVRENFAQSVSGTDLIVGARGGSLQLLLYAVFRIGGATNNVDLSSLEDVARHRAVAWMVPLSLGDSHHGFPVLATTTGYFEHFRYGDRQPLRLAQGRVFSGDLAGLYDVVLGAEVAERLGYGLGRQLTLSHGGSEMPGAEHADKPFTVVGILQRTGTPVDRTLHISLQAMEAIHLDWAAGVPLPGQKISAEQARQADLRPKQVTAALLGLKNRAAVFAVQRMVNDFEAEPLMAVLPGVALDELWDVVGSGERALLAMSALVAAVSLAGLVAVVLAGLNERRRELAVRYRQSLAGINLVTVLDLNWNEIVPHIFVIRVGGGQRDALGDFLKGRGIESGFHYQPNHRLSLFAAPGPFPVAETAADEIITIPLHAALTDDEQGQVIAAIREFAGMH